MTRFRNITSSERTEEDPAISRSSTESPLAAASRGATGARVPSPSSLASSVQEVVMEEWEHVRTEFGNLPSIPQSTRSKVEHLTSSQDDLFMVLTLASPIWKSLHSLLLQNSATISLACEYVTPVHPSL